MKEYNELYNIMKHKASLLKVRKERMRITSKKSKMSKHFYYFFHILWEVYKRLKFDFALIFFL